MSLIQGSSLNLARRKAGDFQRTLALTVRWQSVHGARLNITWFTAAVDTHSSHKKYAASNRNTFLCLKNARSTANDWSRSRNRQFRAEHNNISRRRVFRFENDAEESPAVAEAVLLLLLRCRYWLMLLCHPPMALHASCSNNLRLSDVSHLTITFPIVKIPSTYLLLKALLKNQTAVTF